MERLTVIGQLDLLYFYKYHPATYHYITAKLKDRISKGENVHIVLEDSNILEPANLNRLENFLKDEIELSFFDYKKYA
jgi:hypothetical protein